MTTIAAPRPPRGRLGGLGPNASGLNPTFTPKTPLLPQQKPQIKVYDCCETPTISVDANSTVCTSCGVVFDENAIVSEVTFGETAGGAAMVEGGFIGENQRHANSMGGTMRGMSGMDSRGQSERMGLDEITKLGSTLNVPKQVCDAAYQCYILALNHQFVQGRRVKNVAAVALYMAARRQPDNTLMLMDLAEKIEVNVWSLGDTYKAFLKKLGEKDPAQLVGSRAVLEIEPLMLKYCRKLEFADASFRVAKDAVAILKRMSRDWMVQGRQPAGLCGACIILAARMNNFRRTVREVVYVVKVADTTINARLYEYKHTPSSALTVNQFREYGHRVKVTTLPPAIWRREKKEERREKRKAAAEVDPESAEALEDSSNSSEPEAGPSTAPTRTSKRRKKNDGASQDVAASGDASGTSAAAGIDVDALDGNNENVIAELDTVMEEAGVADPEDGAFVMPPKKRGRPNKRERIVIAPEDLEIERDIEAQVNAVISDWESTFKDMNENPDHHLLRSSGWTAQQIARAELDRRDITVNTDPDIGEDEFDDDPDVATCILGPEEVRIKERIWITENEEWLRAHQKKVLAAELEEAEDKPKKPKQTRKRNRMGDGSLLEGQPAGSAAEAAHRMLKKRSKAFSEAINYDRLKELFPLGDQGSSPSAGGSGQGASPASRTPPVIYVQDEDAEGEEDEEEYEAPAQQHFGDEDEDEGNYLQEEELGFGDEADY